MITLLSFWSLMFLAPSPTSVQLSHQGQQQASAGLGSKQQSTLADDSLYRTVVGDDVTMPQLEVLGSLVWTLSWELSS